MAPKCAMDIRYRNITFEYLHFQIIGLLPRAILDGSDYVPQCLQPLARYINALAGKIFKSSLGYSEQEKRKAK